jgi:hypothetical protein
MCDAKAQQIVTKRRHELTNKLAIRLDREIAEQAVRRVLFIGAWPDKMPSSVRLSEITQRNYGDLFITLVRIAGDYPHSIRELIEQLAFDVLTGKFRISEASA